MSNEMVRDLFLLRDAELDAVRLALTAPWQSWAQAWGVTNAIDARLTARAASDLQDELVALKWQPVSPAAGAVLEWVHVPASMRAALAAQLLGRSSKAALPAEDFALLAADAALADLFKRLSAALPSAAAASSAAGYTDAEGARAQACSPLSGAVLLAEPIFGMQCLLARQAYQSLVPTSGLAAPSKAPVGLISTLAKQRVPITLGLGEVDIPVSDLLGLQVGDVIQFPTRLSDELPLAVAAEVVPKPALRCQLGQRDGHLAVKLVAKTKAAA
ncbi:MAG: FliM/FliN family flagellar motor C-terminal domain-containing protein [Pseudomonadota bacterium]